jgi:hypothetical protein
LLNIAEKILGGSVLDQPRCVLGVEEVRFNKRHGHNRGSLQRNRFNVSP